MEDYIKRKLKNHTQNLRFFGFQSYEQLPAKLSESDVCIFPSIWENFPNVCLEAMAAARVVIATDNGGMAEMITDGIDGYLIKSKSSKSIAQKLLQLSLNPQQLNGIGDCARQTVLSRYGAVAISEMVTKFYQEVLENHIYRY